MELKLYNTLTKRKEPFPCAGGRAIKMYVCGPTVYDFCHLGHAKSYVSFDVIRRYIEFTGCKVEYVQNFTDLAEEITKKALALGERPSEMAERFTLEYFKDMDALNIKRASAYPKVSEHLGLIIETIEMMLKKGLAYVENGDVYFDSSKAKPFGFMSGISPDKLTKGADAETMRRSMLDFALWKGSDMEDGRDSPWGRGRPGWHIECYVMASKHLGLPVDIQGGGLDLVFPHHESVHLITEAMDGAGFARLYMHNGFITMGERKMSKSTGLFVTLRPLIQRFGGMAIRFYLLKNHYRTDLRYDSENIAGAANELVGLWEALDELRNKAGMPGPSASGTGKGHARSPEARRFEEGFFDALDDDLDTPKAIERLGGFLQLAAGKQGGPEAVAALESASAALDILGLLTPSSGE